MSFQPKFNLIEELRWRGLLHDAMPGTEEILQKEMVTGYVGFDPTADSLHIGNLVPITLLILLQKAGHKPIALVGGATGMVGDPSGKSDERKLLDAETLEKNLNGQKQQLEKFLNFTSGENKAVMVNNYDWFKTFSFLDFIRDVGKHITVSYMMSKDSVKNRMESAGISFTEFTYQLVQGFDFYYLYENFNCKLQMGGSDQWGNITTGTELIRRKSAGTAFAITAPLVTKSDGTKFGKSEGGNIWLDRNRTSPFSFYQFWLNVADEDAIRFIKIYSLKEKGEIEAVIAAHAGQEHMRIVQKALANELTERIHSQADLDLAIKASEIFFGKGNKSTILEAGAETIEAALEGFETVFVSRELLNENINILDFVTQHIAMFPSKSEARKLIMANGFSMNKEKINQIELNISIKELLFDKYLLLQKGKSKSVCVVFQ